MRTEDRRGRTRLLQLRSCAPPAAQPLHRYSRRCCHRHSLPIRRLCRCRYRLRCRPFGCGLLSGRRLCRRPLGRFQLSSCPVRRFLLRRFPLRRRLFRRRLPHGGFKLNALHTPRRRKSSRCALQLEQSHLLPLRLLRHRRQYRSLGLRRRLLHLCQRLPLSHLDHSILSGLLQGDRRRRRFVGYRYFRCRLLRRRLLCRRCCRRFRRCSSCFRRCPLRSSLLFGNLLGGSLCLRLPFSRQSLFCSLDGPPLRRCCLARHLFRYCLLRVCGARLYALCDESGEAVLKHLCAPFEKQVSSLEFKLSEGLDHVRAAAPRADVRAGGPHRGAVCHLQLDLRLHAARRLHQLRSVPFVLAAHHHQRTCQQTVQASALVVVPAIQADHFGSCERCSQGRKHTCSLWIVVISTRDRRLDPCARCRGVGDGRHTRAPHSAQRKDRLPTDQTSRRVVAFAGHSKRAPRNRHLLAILQTHQIFIPRLLKHDGSPVAIGFA
mmetsp:Transcript_14044/g.36966  ORF Transcript_14044/g.36966 Transcript_14044/m.36966 type:complete len:491 (-) Transcript_14044:654-2126(-)